MELLHCEDPEPQRSLRGFTLDDNDAVKIGFRT